MVLTGEQCCYDELHAEAEWAFTPWEKEEERDQMEIATTLEAHFYAVASCDRLIFKEQSD